MKRMKLKLYMISLCLLFGTMGYTQNSVPRLNTSGSWKPGLTNTWDDNITHSRKNLQIPYNVPNLPEPVKQTGTVQEQNDYYPYGGRHIRGSTYALLTGNNHKFNGKEEQTSGYLDYGARMYDNAMARWGTPDPLAEKYKRMSPYNYCLNNPVMFVDPDGKDVYIYFKNKQGKQEYFKYYGQEMNNPHPNQFVNDVITALKYNIKNGGGDPSRTAVYNHNIKIAIAYSNEKSRHNAQGGIIWNSELGSEYTGAVVSPATILDHELDHAIQFKTNYRQWVEGRAHKDANYGNPEEKRVITGSEQKTATANGELKKGFIQTRTNHKGRYFITQGATSNEKRSEYEHKTY